MKKFYAFLLLILCILGFKNSCFAYCPSACSIDALKKASEVNTNAIRDAINEYFELEVKESDFFDKKSVPSLYSELFLFTTVF